MGQRLVVTIKKEKRNLAKIYYHWSAYTTSALQEVKDIIDNLYDEDFNIKNKTAKQIQTVRKRTAVLQRAVLRD